VILYRCFAFRVQALEALNPEPEMCVFFAAHTPEASSATLLRLLALAWGCSPADIDFHSLVDAHDLACQHGPVAPGDAALWVTGQHHGPLFQPADRTLMFVQPHTLRRLLLAHQATLPLRSAQRAAARQADQAAQAQQRQRHGFMADLSQMLRSQPRAGA